MGDVKELLNKTCRRHLLIWGSDANRQLENRNREEAKYAKKEYADKNNRNIYKGQKGGKMKRIAVAKNMPQTSDDTDGDAEDAENSTTRQMEAATSGHGERELGKENHEKYTTTWTIPGGNIRRQIEYIMINAR